MTLLVPARAVQDPAVQSSPAVEAGVIEADVRRPGPNARRVDGAPPVAPPDDRVAVLEVEVVQVLAQIGGGTEQPMPDVEVTVSVSKAAAVAPGAPAAPPALIHRHTVSTTASGIARFEVPGGNDGEASLICGTKAGDGVPPTLVHLSADVVTRTTIRIEPRAVVEGTVVDASGTGIANADLILLPWGDEARPWCVGKSRADGSFSVALAAGGYLGAQHTYYAPSGLTLVRPELDRSKPVQPRHLKLMLLGPQAGAEGTVVDANNRPVADVELEFRSAGPTPQGSDQKAAAQRTSTDADGRFRVGNLMPGQVNYAARDRRHATKQDSFTVAAGTKRTLNITFADGCEVRGTVTTSQGLVVPGAKVAVVATTAFARLHTLSAQDGSFQLTGLPAGTVDLVATAAGNGATGKARTTLTLVVGQPQQWPAVLEDEPQGPRLLGQIVDMSGQPVPNWRVVVLSAPSQGTVTPTSAVTNASGQFSVALPGPGPRGPLGLRIYAANEMPGTSFARAVRDNVDPTAEQTRIVVNPLDQGATLRGVVQTAQQQAVPANLEVWHVERREFLKCQAKNDGTFRLGHVPVGTLDMTFKYAGHATTYLTQRIEANSDLTIGPVVLGAAGSLHGQVTGADGRAPHDLQLTIDVPDKEQTVRTLSADYAAGTYRFDAVPPGRHVLRVAGASVSAWAWNIEVTEGVDLELPIELKAGVPRHLVVTAPTEAGAQVTLGIRDPQETSEASLRWFRSTTRSVDGTFQFLAIMAPGTYEVVAGTGEHWRAHANVTFVAGDDSEVRLHLQRQ